MRWIGAAVLAVLFGAALVVASASASPPWQGIDTAWRDLLAAHRTGALTWTARTLHTGGNTLGTTIVGLALAAYWLVRRERVLAMFVLVSAVVVRIVVNVGKYLVDRQRPPDPVVDVVGQSFPSGHVSSATVLAAVVAIVLAHRGRLWPGVVLTAVTALVMAWDRTYLSVHWLSDTIAAAAVAIAVPLVLWPLFAARVTRDGAGGRTPAPPQP